MGNERERFYVRGDARRKRKLNWTMSKGVKRRRTKANKELNSLFDADVDLET